jgi:hypothetical protein
MAEIIAGTKSGNREFSRLLLAGVSGMERNNSRANRTYEGLKRKKLDRSMAIQLFQKCLIPGNLPVNDYRLLILPVLQIAQQTVHSIANMVGRK